MSNICGIDIRRRSATRAFCFDHFRGLKPTATSVSSLRDFSQAALRADAPRSGEMLVAVGFQPTGVPRQNTPRRGATPDIGNSHA